MDQLLTHLRQQRFLAVVGASGSGKSSLVRAGLIPALHGGAMVGAGSHWRVVTFRPGEDPYRRMARCLNKCGLIAESELSDTADAILEATLRRNPLGLVEAYRLANLADHDNLLVVVDQFEELFRYRGSGQTGYEDDSVAFVKLLLASLEESRIYVALTMRSDFIGNCADFPGLPAAVTEGQYLVPRMSRAELRQAIIGPVSAAGAAIDPRLVVRLLNEAGEDPDQLPVLQHALMRTWECWKRDHQRGEPVDIPHYEAVGTMANALSQHAEEAYAELNSDLERQIAEKVFKALTGTDLQGRGIRHPTSLGMLSSITGGDEQEVARVLDRFRAEGRSFLAPPPSVALSAASIIDLSHESLMRVWKRLEAWVAEEQQSSELYLRLTDSAQRHTQGQQSLWRNPELGMSLQWLKLNAPNAAWASRYRNGFDQAMSFLEQSRRADQKRRIFRLALVSAIVFLALAAVGLYALAQRSENQRLMAVNHELNDTVERLRTEISNLTQRPQGARTTTPPNQVLPEVAPAPATSPLDRGQTNSSAAPSVPASKPSQADARVASAPPEPPPPTEKASDQKAPDLSDFAREMLAAHNAVRVKTGVPPLMWSNALAARAQKWADSLAATNQSRMEGIPGQNIGYGYPSGRMKGTDIVDGWADEVSNYDYKKNACIDPKQTCNHYTQVVWSDSKDVGCGAAHDAERDIWVCDYDPPGNELGVRPY